MSEFIPILLQIISALLALLLMILSWFGNRIQNQLDEIQADLTASEKEVLEVVSKLDMRVTRLETRCALRHAEMKGGG